jgi:hypothetical protein
MPQLKQYEWIIDVSEEGAWYRLELDKNFMIMNKYDLDMDPPEPDREIFWKADADIVLGYSRKTNMDVGTKFDVALLMTSILRDSFFS